MQGPTPLTQTSTRKITTFKLQTHWVRVVCTPLWEQTTKPHQTLGAGLPRPVKGKRHVTEMATVACLKAYRIQSSPQLLIKVSFSDPQASFHKKWVSKPFGSLHLRAPRNSWPTSSTGNPNPNQGNGSSQWLPDTEWGGGSPPESAPTTFPPQSWQMSICHRLFMSTPKIHHVDALPPSVTVLGPLGGS